MTQQTSTQLASQSVDRESAPDAVDQTEHAPDDTQELRAWPAGEPLRNFELTGVRTVDGVVELLCVTDELEALRDIIAECYEDWEYGFDAYNVGYRGESRKVDAVQTKRTKPHFIGQADWSRFSFEWVKDHDGETMDDDGYFRLYGESKNSPFGAMAS